MSSRDPLAASSFPLNTNAALPWGTFPSSVPGCEECNRKEPKPWPIYTVTLSNGEEVCAKCLTPMRYART
jgi:hypothetical protein